MNTTMKLVLGALLVLGTSVTAAADLPQARVADAPAQVAVDFQLFDLQDRGETLLTSFSIIAGGPDLVSPISIEREQTFIAHTSRHGDTIVSTPATASEGFLAVVKRFPDREPLLELNFSSVQRISQPRRDSQSGVAEVRGFFTAWPLDVGAGQREYNFQANGRRYRAVISAH